MGCFDTVRFRCPACFEAIEVQSKGGLVLVELIRSLMLQQTF